jgi:hypothetical protein
MSRRFTRVSLLFVLMLTSKVWAIGLGDINLDSALNEPLRAEIVLLSASPYRILRSHWRQLIRSPDMVLTGRSIFRKSNSMS